MSCLILTSGSQVSDSSNKYIPEVPKYVLTERKPKSKYQTLKNLSPFKLTTSKEEKQREDLKTKFEKLQATVKAKVKLCIPKELEE